MPSVKNLLERAYARAARLEPDYLKRRRRRRRRMALNPQLWQEVEEHPERAITERTRQSSERLFYAFQGRGMGLMMEPLKALRETGLINTNLVMLRDYYGFFYHAGINRELPDIDSVIRRLQAIRATMPHVTHTACMGTSAGGYAALLFGHYLQVDTVYAFAPQTYFKLRDVKRVAQRNDIWRFPKAHCDLARLLATHNGCTRYRVFFCAGNRTDRRFAERIAGSPGVELHPQPGNTHYILHAMLDSGQLRTSPQTSEDRGADSVSGERTRRCLTGQRRPW